MKRTVFLLATILCCKNRTSDVGPATSASQATSQAPSASQTGAAPNAGPCKLTDACLVVTKEDVEGGLGGDIKPGEHGSDISTRTVSVTSCNYAAMTPGKPSVHVTMRCGPHTDKDMSGVKKTFGDLRYTTITDVIGVGDVAAWGSRASGGKTQGQVDVYKGESIYLIVSVRAFADDASALSAAKTLAGKGLAKL